MQSTSATNANRQIARAAIPIMLAFTLSQVIGLVEKMLATRAFGTGDAIDAYNTASSFPNMIFSIIAGGALASSLIPIFSSLITKGNKDMVWKLAFSMINIICVLLIILSAVSAIFAPQIITLLAKNYSFEKHDMSVRLLRILLITTTIFGISGILSALLNAHQVFFIPAIASSMYWLGAIFGLLFLTPTLGIFGLAWGAVLGSILHLLIQLPKLSRLIKHTDYSALSIRNPLVREVIFLMGPRLINVATVQSNLIVNTIIANKLETGSVSALNWAFPIMTMPLIMIGQAIGFAALPTFSEQVARGDLIDMRNSLASMIRVVLLLSLPASFGLIVLRRPLISLLFQGGMFNQHSTDQVAWALLWFTTGLVGHATLELLARAFYAIHDTRTPALVSVLSVLLNVAFSLLFTVWFASLSLLPLGGLALANSLATIIESLVLLFIMRYRLSGLELPNIFRTFIIGFLASTIMGIFVMTWLHYSSGESHLIIITVGVVFGGLIYFVILLLLRVREVTQIQNWLNNHTIRKSR